MEYPEPKEPSAALLKEWYADPLCKSASTAMGTLLRKGCERHLIEGYLRRIAGYRRSKSGISIYRGPKPAEAARQLRGCARQIRKVAQRIAELRKVWGLWGRLVDGQCIDLPEELLEIAERLCRVRTKAYSRMVFRKDPILNDPNTPIARLPSECRQLWEVINCNACTSLSKMKWQWLLVGPAVSVRLQ